MENLWSQRLEEEVREGFSGEGVLCNPVLNEPVNGAKVGEGRPCRESEEQKLEVDGSG